MAINPRSSLYLFLTDKLSGLITSELIKIIQRYNNQIEKENTSGASITPSVLIQIENDFEDPTANYSLQKGWVYVTLHVGIDISKLEGVGTEDWEIFQGIYESLQGQVPTEDDLFNWTALTRIGEVEDNDYDGFYHGKSMFKTFLTDCTQSDADDGKITGTIDTFTETQTVEHGVPD